MRGAAAILSAAVFFTPACLAPAFAQENDGDGDAPPFEVVPPPPPADSLMTGEELRAAFSGADYQGCYPDGSLWAERTAADGALHDLLRTGAPLVGVWWVQQNQICYFYDTPGATACWEVVRRGRHFDFYFPGAGQIGGTTDCGEPIA